ncbi:hypothetical protein Nepgr_012593 [Nepenthes gracilis]|uniref:Selenoprotein H n=1 Tax=Nepenthes gracilis TaxID=150966 RepID=A0AAD3XMX9_NEPGR|nr:hypothetical protein Nepgr_012593 [Nepenthes gracilis]
MARTNKLPKDEAQAIPVDGTLIRRETRSMTRRTSQNNSAADSLAADNEPPKKKSKKAKMASSKNDKTGSSAAQEEKTAAVSDKRSEKEERKPVAVEKKASYETIIIEHCKQCNSFKQRALKVKEGLEKGASGITVIVNPEKPRRGCFEIRVEDGETFITLLDMKRPFKPMKELDMDKVISDILEKIHS